MSSSCSLFGPAADRGAGPLAAAGLPPLSLPPLPATPQAVRAEVAAPIGHPSFGDDLSYKVLVLTGQRVQSAELSVTPADLGPISVSIEVRGQEAALSFGAAHATTRAALEDALPRLREMLAAQGLQLAQAQVGDVPRRGFGDAPRGQGARGGGSGSDAPRALQGVAGTEAGGQPRRLGIIDIHV